MLSRLYTFSSRILKSSVFWVLAGILCVEAWAWATLPSTCFSHVLDRLLWNIEKNQYDEKTIVLGDSVGRQISRHLALKEKAEFFPLATNGAIEMAGQYFLFLRYIERNAIPESVILLKHNLLHGDLQRVCTENYVQRCFTRGYECLSMTWQTRNMSFGLQTLTYRLATAKYRLQLQHKVPYLDIKPIADIPEQAKVRIASISKRTILQSLADKLFPRKGNSISEYYLEKLIEECHRRNIKIYYFPCPKLESKIEKYCQKPSYNRLVKRMAELSAEYPNFTYDLNILSYPDEYFSDDIHIKKSYLPEVAGDYGELIYRTIAQ